MKKLFRLYHLFFTAWFCGLVLLSGVCAAGFFPSAASSGALSVSRAVLPAAAVTETEALRWDTSDTDISKVDANRKLIAFTFDDAPDSTLKALTEVFEQFNEQNPDCPASATFFCNGIRIDSGTFPLLKKAYQAGFELGNHTDSHKNLLRLSSEEIRKEIDAVDKILQKIDGKPVHLLRVPYGNYNDKVRREAQAPLIDWEIDTEDWKGISADRIFNEIYSKRRPGSIVLMHDGYRHTVEAVSRLLPLLKAEGWQVVGVSQLSKALGRPLYAGKVYTHVSR
ncbi:MAG TPA: polysaccharide deacetylase family protein [Candidatus Scatosoma pullistercoris]|uniref:Polysaccharide deacetylase family protein n=1 Tax=Candidatus Scatosoma pullistercoris TaxID=2840934 RepID=A0A9D1MGE1_9FIRM|nr:polysaccharide deacetylase family protein [Candidatus Scatosoma pullistercoris]